MEMSGGALVRRRCSRYLSIATCTVGLSSGSRFRVTRLVDRVLIEKVMLSLVSDIRNESTVAETCFTQI